MLGVAACKKRLSILLTLGLLMTSPLAAALELEKKTICTWDPVGKNGPVISFFSDLTAKAIHWGISAEFIPYEDEREAAKDLISDKCDASILTAIVARDFVQTGGTLDAIGGITSEKELRKVLASITSPKATRLLSSNDYEMVASLPVGSMFAFVNDRNIKSIEDFKEKRISVLNGDIQARMFALLTHAIPVDETLTSFAQSFNDRYVDIVLMPALAYETFELYKGLGKTGGILDIRLFYGMLQVIAKKSSFDDEFGTNMRRYMYSRLPNVLALIDNAEKSIPSYYWIKTPEKDKEELELLYKDIRLALKAENKFDKKSLSLLWKIRCSVSPDRKECEMP